jgi:hypothetical protein
MRSVEARCFSPAFSAVFSASDILSRMQFSFAARRRQFAQT